MKIRTDFVTNSSSSSFIIARKRDLNEEQKKALLEYVEKTFLGKELLRPEDSEESIEKAFEDDWDLRDDEKTQGQIRENLEDGLTVYQGNVVFEETDFRLEKIYRNIWEIVSENADEGHEFVAIDNDLIY